MTDQLQLLSLDAIAPAKDNPRRDVGDVTELAASIKSVGILEPLTVIARPKLPDAAKKALDDGKLQLADAYELTKIAALPERVKHAIDERSKNGYYRDMKQVVDQELELQKRDEVAATTRARLQSEGVKLYK